MAERFANMVPLLSRLVVFAPKRSPFPVAGKGPFVTSVLARADPVVLTVANFRLALAVPLSRHQHIHPPAEPCLQGWQRMSAAHVQHVQLRLSRPQLRFGP